MNVSAGLIITNGEKILLGHSTNNPHWDIPKGMVDPGESYLQAAIRECKEEFNLTFNSNKFQDLGRFKYSSRKDLYLFKILLDELPDPSKCKCNSHFISRHGRYLPEIDDYRIFPHEIGLLRVAHNMKKCFITNGILGDIL